MVTRTRANVTSHEHCPSSYLCDRTVISHSETDNSNDDHMRLYIFKRLIKNIARTLELNK